MKRIPLFLLLLFSVLPFAAFAQDTPTDTAKKQISVITKNDGTEYIGVILSDDGREVLIETQRLGKIYIPKSDIKSIDRVESEKQIVYGEFQNTGPFTTRYCFTTNALPIKKGENYALINLYGPEVHFAVSDRFSVGVMATWIASPLVLALKYSIPTRNEKINFSIGTLAGTSGYLNMFRGFGALHFGNVTYGSRKSNVTFSAGYAYVQAGIKREYGFPGPGVYYVEAYNMPYNMAGQYFSRNAPMVQGPIFSIACISKVGAKASFVFDSMVGIFSSIDEIVSPKEITPPDFSNLPYTPGTYEVTVTDEKVTNVSMFVMPGMRFQSTDRKAFQVALAGVAIFRNKDRGNNSFPFPMCTWFYRF
jgi:hypothetical protein